MADQELRIDARIKVVPVNRSTLTSLLLANTVIQLFKEAGVHPLLGEVLTALVGGPETRKLANPREAKNPSKYWRHRLNAELQPGGSLQYLD